MGVLLKSSNGAALKIGNGLAIGSAEQAPEYPAGPVYRMEADTGVVNVGTEVSAWEEQEGANISYVPAFADPNLTLESSPSGRSAVAVTDNQGWEAFSTGPLPTGSSARTLVMVWRPEAGGFWGGFKWGTAVNDQGFGIVSTSGTDLVAIDFYNSQLNGRSAGTWAVDIATYDGSTAELFSDNVSQGTSAKTLNTGTANTLIAISYPGGAQTTSACAIGAIFVYDRVISASERAQITTYLTDKYLSNSVPPVITNFALSSGTATTLPYSFDSNEGGTYDIVLSTSATQPSVAQVRAGQDHTGSSAPFSASDTLVGASNGGTAAGLTDNTTYYAHMVAGDGAYDTAVQTTAGQATLDASAIPPIISALTYDQTDTFSMTATEAGSVYWLVDDNATRTAAQVEAGGGEASGSFAVSASSDSDNIDMSTVSTGDHYIHFVLKDSDNLYSGVESREYEFL
ncbi:MAG: hypothetical protein ACPG4X_15745 [Pikeienuella sp.]